MAERRETGEGRDPGWERHRRERLAAGAAATPAERVRWLEEVLLIAHRVGALPRPRKE